MPNVLTTRSWPVRQKRIGASWTVSHIEHYMLGFKSVGISKSDPFLFSQVT